MIIDGVNIIVSRHVLYLNRGAHYEKFALSLFDRYKPRSFAKPELVTTSPLLTPTSTHLPVLSSTQRQGRSANLSWQPRALARLALSHFLQRGRRVHNIQSSDCCAFLVASTCVHT
jgi:hypothetical protein